MSVDSPPQVHQEPVKTSRVSAQLHILSAGQEQYTVSIRLEWRAQHQGLVRYLYDTCETEGLCR